MGHLRVLSARVWKSLSVALWPSELNARIATAAAFISVISALATVWSARSAEDQALSAHVSANAASETLRRSDEDLRILVDVDRAAPVAISFTISEKYFSFSINFSANAVIVNTGGSPAVVTDSMVETYAAESTYSSRTNIFDASTGAPWSRFVVIRPNEPLRLNLLGSLSGSNRRWPTVTKALVMLFAQHEHQNERLKRQFDSLEALTKEVRSRAGEEAASEFDDFLYGPATKPGRSTTSDPWSEEGETGFSRIILRVSTASRRTYRSSPGLLAFGPNPAYSILEVPWK